jgi:radical SAM-linked protein
MRVRFRFSKLGKVRFTSHRDVARVWERALRRAALPIAMTEGFSPRPKVHFGLALSTGYESYGEYLDVDFDEGDELDVDPLPELLTPLLPAGLSVDVAVPIDRREPSLQQAVTSCTWEMRIAEQPGSSVADRAAGLLARASVPVTRERKGQLVHDDLRPSVLALDVRCDETSGPSNVTLEVELSTQPRGVRPAELLNAFEPPLPDPITDGGRVCRTQQWITTTDGARREPLSLHATSVPHAEERAS